jgi:TRAP-type C4-dicarboxylate transport system permease small subunit
MLFVAGAVLCQMLLVRYLLQTASYWQTEFVTYALIGATFLGAPHALMTGKRLSVNLVPRRLGSRTRFWLVLATHVLAAAFCITVTAAGAGVWHDAWVGGRRSETVWAVPLWIPYLAVPIGFGILSLQYIADILRLLADRPDGYGSATAKPGH